MLDFITISPALAALTTGWRISGYSRANTDSGKLYAALAYSGGDLEVRLYRDAAMQPASLVASGTAAVGEALALVAANDSGLSGSLAVLDVRLAEGDLLVFHACDDDLHAHEAELASLLDGSGNFAGARGFEAFTSLAKREIDSVIAARLRSARLADGESSASWLLRVTNRDRLAEPAALLALSLLFERLSGAPDAKAAQRSREYRLRYLHALAAVRLEFSATDSACALSLSLGDVPVLRA